MRLPFDRPRLGLAPAFALILAASASALGQAPTPLASRIPAKDLLFYAQSDGLDAQQAAWKASAASKVLNETTLGVMLEDLAKQGLDLVSQNSRGVFPAGAEVLATLKQFARNGFAIGVNGNLEKGRATGVIRGGAKPETFAMVVRLLNATPRPGPMKEMKKGSRKVTVGGPAGQTALIEDKGDLIICVLEDLDATIAVLDGKEPSSVGNPMIAELARPEGTFRPMIIGFFDPKKLGELPADAKQMGLDGVERVDFRWGFRDDAIYSVFRVKAPSPRKGVLGLLDGPTFDKTSMAPMPPGVTGFAAFSIAPAPLWDKIEAIARTSDDPKDRDAMAGMQAGIERATGVKLRGDILAKLGPRMAGYSLAPSAPGGLPIEVAFVGEVKDGKGFAGSLGKLFDVLNQVLKSPRPGQPAAQATLEVRKLAGQVGFELNIPEGAVPPGPLTAIKPTLLIGEKYLAFGTMPGAARKALDAAEGRGPAWKPAEAQVAMMNLLPKGMIALSVSDPRQTLPPLVENLPTLLAVANQNLANRPGPGGPGGAAGPAIPIEVDAAKIPPADQLTARLFPASSALVVDAEGVRLIGRESLPNVASPGAVGVMTALLLPAVQSAREAARRSQCVNNIKQIGLAMHNFHSANNSFPAAAIADKDGKPLLSWRVAILPYIEQGELYNKFHLDEPWDSAHNKPLIAEMPKTYACPTRKNPEAGMTTYCGFTGDNAFFEGAIAPALQTITDGTSNTLMVVESANPVIWSKPDDLPFDPESKQPNFGAGSPHPGGFNALFGDGSVRFLKRTIDAAVLKALISPHGGEVISADSY